MKVNYDNALFHHANAINLFKGSNISEFNELCACNQSEKDCPKICNCRDGIDSHVSKCNVSDYKGKIFFLVRVWTAVKFS